jgi:hypothetical protein
MIKPQLKASKKETRPAKYDVYDIFCAVLYVLKEGCRWRSLPHDYPPWKAVCWHYMFWSKKKENGISLLDEILIRLVGLERQYSEGRPPKTTLIIPDSRSVKTTDTAGEKGYDGGKKNIGHKASPRS